MLLRLAHNEQCWPLELGEIIIPLTFVEARSDLVDLLESLCIGDSDLGRRQADNWAVLLVHVIDVVHALACDDGDLEAYVSPFGVPRSRNLV